MRSYTKISAAKPPPKKRLVSPMTKMSARLKGAGAFKSMGK